MTQKSDLAIKLVEALKAKGYYNIGILSLTDDEAKQFEGMSGQAMADIYAKNHALAEKTKVYNIVMGVYNDTQKDEQVYSLRTNLGKAGLLVDEYVHAFQHSPMFTIQGTGAGRKYRWAKQDKPIFSDVLPLYDFVKSIAAYQINSKIKEYIKENCDLDYPEMDNIVNPNHDPIAFFKMRAFHRNQRAMKNAKKKPITFSKEISRTLPPEAEQVETKVSTEVKEEPSIISSLENFLKYQQELNKAAEIYYKLKFEAQEKYIESLEKRLSEKSIAQ